MAESVPFAASGVPDAYGPAARRWSARLVSALPLALAGAAGLLLGASLLPTDLWQARLGAIRADGQAGVYTAALFQHLAERLRFAGAVFAAAGLLALIARRQTAVLVGDALVAARPFRADVARGLAALAAEPPAHRAALAAIVLAGALLRVAFVTQPVRYDEALTFTEFASRPLYYALSFYPEPNNQLLHTLLVHVSYLVFGNQLWAIRLPALLAGVLLVPASYAAGRLLYERDSALLATALVAASSVLVEYSTNARGYTLLTLCFLVTLGLAAYVSRSGNRLAVLVLAVVAALGFYTIPTMLYGFATVLVWLAWALLAEPRGERTTALATLAGLAAATLLLTFVLYLPPMLVSGPDNVMGNRFVTPLSWPEFVAELPASLRATWGLWMRDLPAPLVAVVVFGFVLGLGRRRSDAHGGIPAALAAPVACLPILVVQRVVPFERVWLFLLPLVFLTAAAGLASALRWGLGADRYRLAPGLVAAAALAATLVLGVSVLTAGSVLRSAETGSFPDAQAVALLLRDRLGPEDAVVTTVPASLPELQYEFRYHGLDAAALVRDPLQSRRVYLVAPPTEQAPAAGLAGSNWGQPEPVGAFASARVYAVSRSSQAPGR